MIRYTLNCAKGHEFESWFANSGAFDKQQKRGLVTCPVCGSAKVEKAIMAPRLARPEAGELGKAIEAAEAKAVPSAPAPPAPPASASMPPVAQGKGTVAMTSPQERELRQKLKELRDHVTKNSNYVGGQFPEQARKMHYGEIEHGSIYGEASPEEAKALHEEGIEFHPLPILPDDHN
jgi:hypothetical protein